MRKTFWLIWFFLFPVVVFAQKDQSSWSNLSGLKAGQSVRVVDASSKVHNGAFGSVSDTAIIIRESSGETSIGRQDIRSVKLMKGMGRGTHVLIGAGIGAGAGAGILAAGWESNGFLGGKGAGAAVGAVIGGLLGAVIGVVLPVNHPTLYGAPSH